VDSRTSRGGRAIRRRRECLACGLRFTTYEHVEQEPLTVRKQAGAIEPYQRSKLIHSLRVACAKRPVSLKSIEQMADEIEEELVASADVEIGSRRIGELVMSQLRTRDQIAYVRFASVYRNFEDTTEFMEEVRNLLHRAGYEARGQGELFDSSDGADGKG